MDKLRPLTIVFSYASFRFTDSKVGKGGEEYMAWEIISRLAARGHLCHIFSPSIELSRQYKNIVAHPIKGCNYRIERRWLARMFKVLRFHQLSRRRIRRLATKNPVDVVHHLVPAYPGFSSSVSDTKIPFVYGPATVTYDRALEGRASRGNVVRTLYKSLKLHSWKRTLRRARAILVQVNYAATFMPSDVLQKTYRVFSAADTEYFVPAAKPDRTERFEVLFLASLRRNKGVDVFLKAIPIVHREIPEAHFLLVGPNHEPEVVTSLLESLAIEDIVEVVGSVPHDRTREYYQKADIYCIPSRQDTAPASLFEAMACGVPVVSTTAMGLPELIEPGVNGLLVPPDDASALAGAIIQLLRSPETLSAMRRANREKALNDFSWKRHLDCFEDAYREALS